MTTAAGKPRRRRTLAVPVGVEDHVIGSPGALLALVEYGDDECRACADAVPVADAVRAEAADAAAALRGAHR